MTNTSRPATSTYTNLPTLRFFYRFFNRVQVACMTSLGIDAAKQKPIWRALATVLNLGNVHLTSEVEKEQGEAEAAKERAAEAAEAALIAAAADTTTLPVSPEAPGSSSSGPRALLNPQAATLSDEGDSTRAINAITTLLGVSKEQLAHSLTHRTISVGGTSTATILTAPQARAARDSLAKAIYEKLFLYVVGLVNKSIDGSVAAPSTTAATPSKAAGAGAGAGAGSGTTLKDGEATELDQGQITDPGDAPASAAPELSENLAIRLLDLYGFETFPDADNTRFK